MEENIKKISDNFKKVLVINGSPRNEKSCPNMKSKTISILENIINNNNYLIDFELIDLSINTAQKPIIQPCKGCVSSGGGLMCNFPCNCYFKGDDKNPDLMHELDIYDKLLKCDAFIIISPIHWFSLTSQVKAFFDRLVCANLTATNDEIVDIFGKDSLKKSSILGPAFSSGDYNKLLKNHLEGKIGSFFIHGDNGANDYSNIDYPKTFDPKNDDIDINDIVKPFVYQCRYSGIDVPNDLIKSIYVNENVDYYQSNMNKNEILNKEIKELFDKLNNYL